MVQAFNLTLSEAFNKASLFLKQSNHDADLAKTYWMMAFDYSLTDVVMGLNKPIKDQDAQRYFDILSRIVNDEPIQYILGHAYFMDELFTVTPHTLIPREDTEGLVRLASQYLDNKSDAKVLDIGTGTGILAIMIAKLNPDASVFASDISIDAIQVAKQNALTHQVDIEFTQSDLLNDIEPQKFDIIVSNPPYISEDELELMDESVKKHEPSLALFAKDDGLDIYKRLAEQVVDYITEQGLILLEIGFRQGESVSAIYQDQFPDAIIQVIQDLNGKDRYVQVQL